MVKRLRDSIENHMGQQGILGFTFVPIRSKIDQEMAELWPRGCVIPLRTTWDKRGSFAGQSQSHVSALLNTAEVGHFSASREVSPKVMSVHQ